MTKLPAFLIAVMMLIAVHHATAQSFTFTIASPSANSVSDSVLNINVQYYTSTYELARITAVTEGRIDTLNNAGSSGGYINFNGSINITGLIQGNTYQLKVTCRDVLGNEKTDSVNYRFINPPTASIISPTPGNDIWPSLRIKTSHTGFDTCTSTVIVTISSQTVFTYTSVYNDIDTTIVLSNTLNYSGSVALTVTDKWGQSRGTSCSVLADNYHSYPYLTPLYTGAGKILDYNYDKILEARSTGLYIVDSGFQTSSRIPGTYTVPSSGGGKLTPFGAIWSGREWTNGVLRTHSYLGFAGKYATYKAIWNDDTTFPPTTGYGLYRRDLGTRTDTEIFHDYSPPTFDGNTVDPRGSVIFPSGDNSSLGRTKVNGVSNYIATANPPYVFGGKVLYGDTVVYEISRVETPVSTTVYFNNGTSNIVLSQFDYGSYASYKVAGKYIAYPKPGTTNQKQVWVRDSTGNAVQRTFFGTDSYVAGLNEQGDMLFSNANDKCYYLKKDSLNPKEIGRAISAAFYKDNTWYVIKDNTLYRVNVNAYRTIAAGNWSNPASWQSGTVPLQNADVIVDTNIIVDTDVICNTLNVVPPGSITVLPGVHITILH